ncbi:hypothetical protein M0R04_07155 [Candidatus Dojkabacteria bacterium]|jgi:endogenous inhibitor of DNA gyrase (YacG/DUF329 family)|nr:hypothetical protein [Candidatus Dojkabacteria bacterium]
MYSIEELTTIYNNYDKIKFKSPLYYYLLNNTLYLSGKVFPKQRLWHIINNTKDIPKCKGCDNPVKWDDTKTFKDQQYRGFCSNTCGKIHPDTKAKKHNTEILRYGKGRKEIVAKIKQTNNAKFGADFAIQLDEYKQKRVDTNLERYGVGNVTQCSEIIKRREKSNLEKFGFIAPAQNPTIKNKMMKTSNEKYGGHQSRRHAPEEFQLLGDKDWVINQYINNHKPAQEIANILGVTGAIVGRYLTKHNIPIIYRSGYSSTCIEWLESIMKLDNIDIQHALNGGEFKIPETLYSADGYCIETNTIYEFHGNCWHGNPEIYNGLDQCHPFSNKTAGELYQATIKREEKIRSLGYNLVVMWESDFDKL